MQKARESAGIGTVRGKDGFLKPTTQGAWRLPDGSFVRGENADDAPHPDARWFSYYDCAQQILELYAQNQHGYNRIAQILTSEGWLFRDRFGFPRLINSDDVRRITSNWREYGGLILEGRAKERIANEIEKPADVLYDTGRSVFPVELLRSVALVQEKRSVTTRPTGSVKAAYVFPLTRLVRCAHCECLAEAQQNPRLRTRLMGWNQKGRLRYRHAEGVQCGCKKRSVNANSIEKQFLSLVNLLTVSPDMLPLMTEIALQMDNNGQSISSSEQDFEKQKQAKLSKLHRSLENIKLLFEEGDISREEYLIKRESIKRDIAMWQNRTTDTRKKSIELAACLGRLENLKSTWEHADNEERARLAHELFEAIIYDIDAQEIKGFRLKPWASQYLVTRAMLGDDFKGAGTNMTPTGLEPVSSP